MLLRKSGELEPPSINSATLSQSWKVGRVVGDAMQKVATHTQPPKRRLSKAMLLIRCHGFRDVDAFVLDEADEVRIWMLELQKRMRIGAQSLC